MMEITIAGINLSQFYTDNENIMISFIITFATIVLTALYLWLSKRGLTSNLIISNGTRPRFRKREKIMFYGRKMLRRVKLFAKNVDQSGIGRKARESRKKKLVFSLARKILRFKKDNETQWKAREPPPSLLEVDWPELEHEQRLPSELMYLLRNVRVLGHFEKPIFLELCRFIESLFIPANSYLFKVGEPDESIYVVQSGKIHVHITETDGKETCIKEVNEGESVHSLLSILDVLTGHLQPYKTVSAIAAVDSTVLRLPAGAFQIVLERYPESMVRVIQIIMIRLQRVTFMALHNYLGLSHELINPENQSDKSFLVHSIVVGPKGSPIHSIKQPFLINNREGRVAPAGTIQEPANLNYNLPILSHSVTSMPPSSVDTGTDTKTFVGEHKKLTGRKSQDLTGGKVILPTNKDLQGSDFATACTRARVNPILDSPSKQIAYFNYSLAMNSYDANNFNQPNHVNPSNHFPVNQLKAPNYCRGLKSTSDTYTSNNSTLIGNVLPLSNIEAQSVGEILSNNQILEMAMHDITKLLGLKDAGILKGKCLLRYVRCNTTLVKQGDQECSLYFLVTGQMHVQQQIVGSQSEQRTMYPVNPGELVGTLAVLTGEPSFFTIKAVTDVRLVHIAKNDFYSIMKSQPTVVLNVAHTVVQRMSSFVRQIDFALDWILIEAGRALYRQGEKSDCLYIILNGRLRSVIQLQSGKKELVGEYGRGELVGLVEVLTQTDRSTTLMAVRDTELAQIPDELLNLIKRKYPQIVTRLIHLLGQRILGSLGDKTSVYSAFTESISIDSRNTVVNLATVAVLPISDKVPLSNFTLELQHALNGIGLTLRLTSETVQSKLGKAAFDNINEYRLSSWLGQQEDIHRMVLYQCDFRMTPWTQRCIRQSDCILIVGLAEQGPGVGQLEKQLETLSVRAQKELILLHTMDASRLKNTVDWLNSREWCSAHHHIRCPKRIFCKKSENKIMEIYRKLFTQNPDRLSDFSRLARFLTGTTIGVVLGGGGARGCAHVGVIQALTEAGIPIDIIGGTSIGSFMGALWAQENKFTPFKQRAREFSRDMSSLWKKVFDLTYPVTAMFTGSFLNRFVENIFGDCQIEDLWIPYFCITTDLTASQMRIHTHGSLWRYVRSSMSLSGYLPPLCDPVDGHLLLDGGYVNNLPADVMKMLGAQTIFAIDVGSQDEMNLTNYGDELSGWWLLWKRWNPWAETIKVPNMAEIQSRLAYVSCVRQLEQVKSSGYCEYVRPPIDKYTALQFGCFDEIADVGYAHAKLLFSEWEKTGRIKNLFVERREQSKSSLHKSLVPAEANFTDLAELISRIDEPDLDSTYKSNNNEAYGRATFYASEPEEDEDRMSVTSEPIICLNSPTILRKIRSGSEGASPDTGSDQSQDEDDFDLESTTHLHSISED